MSREDQQKKTVDLKLSRRDKIWVALAIAVIISGFVLAVVFDL
jgi:hypothetical protein